MKQFKRIVLTGGPCAGKTSALAYLYDHLTALGWRVLIVPEAATIVLGSTGRLESERDGFYMERAQETILKLQHLLPLELEKTLSLQEEKVVYLYDRAELDNRAYVAADTFARLTEDLYGVTPGYLASKYDAVLHLVTAAVGAEEAYTLSNNESRRETVAQARELDQATQQAWLGHSHYSVIPNQGTFDDKLARILAVTLQVLGEPEPMECERKWVLTTPPPLATLDAVPVSISQTYLTSPEGLEEERRVRSRTVDGNTTYYHTVKTATADPALRVEREEVISEETYRKLLAYRRPGSRDVVKTRYCFVHEGQHFELDHLIEPRELWLLEAELVRSDDEVILPAELGELHEVTGDKAFSNSTLAQDVASA